MNLVLSILFPLQFISILPNEQEPPKIFQDALEIEAPYVLKAREARAQGKAIQVDPSKALIKEWDLNERARILENTPKVPPLRAQILGLMPNVEALRAKSDEATSNLEARQRVLNTRMADLDALILKAAEGRIESRKAEIEHKEMLLRNLSMRINNMTAAQPNRSKKEREKFSAIIASDSARLNTMVAEVTNLKSKQSEDEQLIVQKSATASSNSMSLKEGETIDDVIKSIQLEVDSMRSAITEEEVAAVQGAKAEYESARAEVDKLEATIRDLNVPQDTESYIPAFLKAETQKFRDLRQAEIEEFEAEAKAYEAAAERDVAALFLKESHTSLRDEFWNLDQGWTKLNYAISSGSTALSSIQGARNSISRAQDELQEAKRAEALEAAMQLTKSDDDCNRGNMWTQGSAINSSLKTERAERSIRSAQSDIEYANNAAETFENRAEEAGRHMRAFIDSSARSAHIPRIPGFNFLNRVDSAATWMNAHDGYSKGITQVSVMLGLRKAGTELSYADSSLYSMASSISSAQNQLIGVRDDIPQMKEDLLQAYNKNLHAAFRVYKAEAAK